MAMPSDVSVTRIEHAGGGWVHYVAGDVTRGWAILHVTIWRPRS